ncbi:MAG: Rrf2 family transcriptional regulator [Candidatus Delongbacteria bacterium]
MISQTAEYALRAMVFLAENPDAAHPVPRIAEHTQVPAGYLSKVLQALARAGLVSSQRGLGGGFRLSRTVAEISLLDVVNSVSPIQRITCCPLGLAHHTERLCALHHRLDEAIGLFETSFRDTRLSDLLAGNPGQTFRLAE